MIRLICLLIGYLFGLFQTSFFLGKMHGIDIREYGSGNAGTTNMIRTMGRKAGLITFAGDCLKCIAAVIFVRLLFGKNHQDILLLLNMYTSAGVILGHNFPFYMGFRGGKGIAATAGMVISLRIPILTILGIITFFGIVLCTHYVSLGSLMIYAGLLIELPILQRMGSLHLSAAHFAEMYALTILLALLACWQHRENIKRLRNGTERKSYLVKPKK